MDQNYSRYVSVSPRHYRVIFFIDQKVPISSIRAVFEKNLKVWGGRYNLLVPISNGEIPDGYLPLINDFDADSIFHDKSITVDKIEALHFLNAKIQQIDEWMYVSVNGVNYHYLLNERNNDFLSYNSDFSILHVQGIHAIPLKAKGFYQTNFALYDLHAGQDFLIRNFNNVRITKDNHQDINQLISQHRIYYKSILSQLKFNGYIHRPVEYSHNEHFQIIISDDSTSADYFYFWNRQQYIENNTRLSQLIITLSELELLLADPHFEHLLYTLSFNNHIELVSQSIPAEKLGSTHEALQKTFKHIRFTVSRVTIFPYPIRDYRYFNQLESERSKQLFRTSKDLLKLPLPRLNDKIGVQGGMAYDIEIEGASKTDTSQHIKFPRDYPIHDGRVNKQYNLTVYHGTGSTAIEFLIPDGETIFQTRLQQYAKNEKGQKTGIQHLRKSSAGKKMFALLNLFENRWDNLFGYVEDKFWLDIFRFDSIKRGKSDIPKQRGIFSFKDLRNEQLFILNHFKEKVGRRLARYNVKGPVEEQFDKILEREMPDVLNNLKDLIEIDAVFSGMKVKCSSCGSNKWYALKDLQNKMTCSGCLNQIIPEAESPQYYKVNEIVVNNFLNDPTSNGKEYDGNYVVLRALNYLRMHARKSFIYHVPMDYSVDTRWPPAWKSDIDILAVRDGEMILGEAKTNATDFNRNEIENLIWIAKNIRPSKILVAFLNGEFDTMKKEQINKEIAGTNVDLLIYKAELPSYGGHFVS